MGGGGLEVLLCEAAEVGIGACCFFLAWASGGKKERKKLEKNRGEGLLLCLDLLCSRGLMGIGWVGLGKSKVWLMMHPPSQGNA